MLLLNKSEINKIPSPEKLFVMYQTGLVPNLFLHRRIVDGHPVYHIKRGSENCAVLFENEVEETLKRFPDLNFTVENLVEFSKKIPLYINFPKGHPLHNDTIEVRHVNGSTDVRDFINHKK